MLKMTRFTVFCRHILVNDVIYGVFQAHFRKMVQFTLIFRHIIAKLHDFCSKKSNKIAGTNQIMKKVAGTLELYAPLVTSPNYLYKYAWS